jgi:hypothetical protein
MIRISCDHAHHTLRSSDIYLLIDEPPWSSSVGYKSLNTSQLLNTSHLKKSHMDNLVRC